MIRYGTVVWVKTIASTQLRELAATWPHHTRTFTEFGTESVKRVVLNCFVAFGGSCRWVRLVLAGKGGWVGGSSFLIECRRCGYERYKLAIVKPLNSWMQRIHHFWMTNVAALLVGVKFCTVSLDRSPGKPVEEWSNAISPVSRSRTTLFVRGSLAMR